MSTENPYANLPPGAGPDGGTLLGFLASVGALVAFTRLYPEKRVTLHWNQSLGWRGRILIAGKSLIPAQIQALHSSLTESSVRDLFTRKASDGGAYATITKIEIDDATRFLAATLQEDIKVGRHSSATLAGWFMDQLDEKSASASRLCALTGGSQQNFLETALHLSGFHPKAKDRLEERFTTVEHLLSTLLEVWQFKEPMPGCRWEAQEDRHSALRHAGTTKKHEAQGEVDTKGYDGSVCTQRGANRLGIEAMTCFPLMSGSRRAETTGFRKRGRLEQFTWPVWESPLSLETVRVLVAHPEFTEEKPNHQILLSLGVGGVFRSTRYIKNERQVCFTIARAL